jgi:hypothetical protein
MVTLNDSRRLSTEDICQICAEARRRRNEYLGSLVLAGLSWLARTVSERLSTTPKSPCGGGLSVAR